MAIAIFKPANNVDLTLISKPHDEFQSEIVEALEPLSTSALLSAALRASAIKKSETLQINYSRPPTSDPTSYLSLIKIV
jgi:hypothetical protein